MFITDKTVLKVPQKVKCFILQLVKEKSIFNDGYHLQTINEIADY